MSRFRLLFLSVLLHGYVGLRIVPALSEWAGICFGAVLLVSAMLMPMTLLARQFRQPLADMLAWAGSVSMGFFSSLIVLTLLRDALLAVRWACGSVVPGLEASTVSGIGATAAAVPLLAFLASLLGLFNARRTAAVVRIDVPIVDLPEALHGFTIAQLSDIHVGPTIKRGYLGPIVDAVNRLDADMVAVTGDLVDGSVSDLGAQVGTLAGLTSRHGTFFVTGNHEYYSGAVAWVRELRRIGFQVLMNQHVVLSHDGASLIVAGVTDYGAHHFDPGQRSDPAAALDGAPVAAPRVLLAHQPRSADAAERAGFDLQLSGHTHGGQFWPWVHFVRFQQPFTAGLHRLRRLWVYTSRGTGYWGPPKRLGAPSEITFLRLVPASV